jgi:hypothetical protein
VTIFGTDISDDNAGLTIAQVKAAGLQFATARALSYSFQGSTPLMVEDPSYAGWRDEARAMAFPFACYVLFHNYFPVRDQVTLLGQVIGDKKIPVPLASGGGIINGQGNPGTADTVLTLNNSQVNDNTAGGNGGGIANGLGLDAPRCPSHLEPQRGDRQHRNPRRGHLQLRRHSHTRGYLDHRHRSRQLRATRQRRRLHRLTGSNRRPIRNDAGNETPCNARGLRR